MLVCRYTDTIDEDGEFTKAVLNRIAKHSKPELAARLIVPPGTVGSLSRPKKSLYSGCSDLLSLPVES